MRQDGIELAPSAPNPTAGRSVATSSLVRGGPVRLCVADLQGRELAVLVMACASPRHRCELDATDLPDGVTFRKQGTRPIHRRILVMRWAATVPPCRSKADAYLRGQQRRGGEAARHVAPSPEVRADPQTAERGIGRQRRRV